MSEPHPFEQLFPWLTTTPVVVVTAHPEVAYTPLVPAAADLELTPMPDLEAGPLPGAVPRPGTPPRPEAEITPAEPEHVEPLD